ncbi:synaptotagmin-9-like isoform X2 [Lycorma delicatula]|uniref:synaptotagmin-9-like isoform X2 n=1 Tax=Lycorma delicatula TaxID=130591 RepID=UPI003F50E0A0
MRLFPSEITFKINLFPEVFIQLGVWGRILVIAIGGAVVVISVLVAACFLGPGCWGYKYLYKKNQKKAPKSTGLSLNCGEFMVSDVGSAAVVTLYNINKSFKKTPINYRTSVCSTVSEASLTSSSNASCTSFGFMPLPAVSIIFQYVTSNPGKLIIFLRHVDGLPEKEFPHQTEVIVELQLTFNNKVYWTAVSRAVRNERSPEYNSEFSVTASEEDIKRWNLHVTVYDKDRFKGYKELASTDFLLKDLKPSLLLGQMVPHASLMTCYNKQNGHLLLGLSYLPTTQRLTLSLVKAANLSCLADLVTNQDFRPFARIFLLDGRGKVIQKRKTEELVTPECARRCSFNSVLTMQVTASQMLTATLLIILCYKPESIRPKTGFVKNSFIEKISRDEVIGRVALGNLVTGSKERKHWQAMQEHSRRAVTSWHTLR